MQIAPLARGDWTRFIDLAIAENWRVPKSERILFQNGLSRYMFALRESGRVCGFVSAVPHQQGGWIGNLIIDRKFRNRGYGTLLFDHALQVLENAGCRDLWLTASAMGKPLYEKKGFRTVDRIVRWVLTGAGSLTVPAGMTRDGLDMLCRQDQKAWMDCRRDLLLHLGQQGTVLSRGQSIALLQAGLERRVLGPWLSDHLCPNENRQILNDLSGMIASGGEIVTDIVESSGLDSLLEDAGFRRHGNNELMVRSRQFPDRLAGVVALASLGSIG